MSDEAKSRNRDDYFRCRICKQLFLQEDCEKSPIDGAYICPSGCEPTFEQPVYESPLQTEE